MPRALLVDVFGSEAKGKARCGSDIDVAVLLREDCENRPDYLELKVELERALDKDVDLVILNDASEVLKHQVRTDGKIIYEIDPELTKKWILRSRKMYEDYLHLHRIFMKKLYQQHGLEDG
ncbi:MAG: nucleotidyltransferase domain-containing protein [Deltaproteobacteria bacterium]|nr:MAG: nucleotidyltransferase domain-containing protein [Deltaproteobacteria bacterium]RLB09541.1 MAG: nucleotidyltransferase domain-containing protein [Deltaproteobacteria bacterium]HEC31343.1 nucleotidyltransferase domain-containing protein [Deltaproteobacteria bacterium]